MRLALSLLVLTFVAAACSANSSTDATTLVGLDDVPGTPFTAPQRCANDVIGAAYPADWKVATATTIPCSGFDPVSGGANTDGTLPHAITLTPRPGVLFDTAVREVTGPLTDISTRPVAVAGQAAIEIQGTASSRSALPEGASVLRYVVNLEGCGVLVASTFGTDDEQFAQRRQVLVDMMVGLRDEPIDGGDACDAPAPGPSAAPSPR